MNRKSGLVLVFSSFAVMYVLVNYYDKNLLLVIETSNYTGSISEGFFSQVTEGSTNEQNVVEFCPDNNSLSWTFDCFVRCETMPNFTYENTRKKKEINCSNLGQYVYSDVEPSFPVQTMENEKCISDFVIKHCYDGNPVPNLVHYIWFSKHEMNFFHFLSVLSASRILKPCLILFHGEFPPFGKYWDYLLHLVDNIIHVKVLPPDDIFGKPFGYIEHRADIGRIYALQKYGGIYIDADEIILKSLNDLRKFPYTMSHAVDFNLSNGLILSEKDAKFLRIWLEAYKTYDKNKWGYHSTVLPFELSKKHGDLIHIENYTFVRPNYLNLPLLFKQNYDWSKNYAIHLYIRYYKHSHDFEDVKYLNTTIGSVARHILYGTKDLCLNKTVS